jgi:hypothetical protein
MAFPQDVDPLHGPGTGTVDRLRVHGLRRPERSDRNARLGCIFVDPPQLIGCEIERDLAAHSSLKRVEASTFRDSKGLASAIS